MDKHIIDQNGNHYVAPLADGQEWALPEGHTEIDPPEVPGSRWADGGWAQPEPVDPNTRDLPRREFRRALFHNGMDTAAIVGIIEAIPDATQREEVTIWWEDTQLFQRAHPMLVSMTNAAGLTEAQADAIWAYGVSLVDGE